MSIPKPPRGAIAAGVIVWLAMMAALAGGASAHTLSDGYVELTARGRDVTGRVTLAARDLHDAIGLDGDGDGHLRWGEIVARGDAVRAYVIERVRLASRAGACVATAGDLAAIHRADGMHVAIAITARCPGPADPLTIDYRAIRDIDAQHRGLVRLDGERGTAVGVAGGDGPLVLAAGEGAHVGQFVRMGMWHIWLGLDHVCFLLALLLPAVYRRERGRWAPSDGLRAVVTEVFEVVTAFTLAHSITLVLSALGWVRLPPRFVETAIALSVAVAAGNNLVRVVDARWAVAFALGLLHGFGFSSVLTDLGLGGRALVAALLGFNLGVEVGQAAIVLAFLPLAYLLRRTAVYRVVLVAGSAAMCLLAMQWSVTRLLA